MSQPFRGGEEFGCDPGMPIGLIVILTDSAANLGVAIVTATGVLTALHRWDHPDGGYLLPEDLRPPRSEARA